MDVSLISAEWNGQLVNGVGLCTSGADDYLEKPMYDSAMLVAKVRELTDP